MNMDQSNHLDELESLLLDWEDGMLDDVGTDRLREILRLNEDARRHFVRLQMIGAALKFDEEAGLNPAADAASSSLPADPQPADSTPTTTTSPASAVSSVERKPARWILAVAALVICLQAAWLIQIEFAHRPEGRDRKIAGIDDRYVAARDDSEEATAHGIALITRLVNATWGAGQQPLDIGDALLPGRFSLASGYAQVEFFCGATVIIEGPAELDLQSPLLARVRSGRLRAQVPPAARGFSLEVDDMTVIDLGTEFGLSVSDEGASVQVFEGEVELQQPAADKRLLTTGMALTRNADGGYSEAEVTPGRFLDIAALESRAAGQRDERYQRWKTWSRAFRHDKRLIAYYSFDEQGQWLRRLNCSVEPVNRELDGAIVGASQVPGRWEEKSGLEFKRPGDRVRVHIPGEFDSLTFACWVKIDSLDRWYNSLFLTDHYNQGEPHWQILDTGQLFFSVRYKPDDVTGPAARKKTHQPVLSPPFWKPSMSGRWLHIATTYDAETGRTKHYLNGEVLHEEEIDPDLLVTKTRIGAASIGNWSIPTRPDSEFAIRNLNGSIDEFAIFAAALPAGEIREMYDHGKP